MAEEWTRDMRNEAKVKANLHAETNRALKAAKQKNKKLQANLIAEERAQRNIEVSL